MIDGLWNKNIARCFDEADEEDHSVGHVAKRILEWSFEEAGMDDTTLFVVKVL